MGKPIAGALMLAVLTWTTTATAATDAEKCEAAKNKVAGKYAFCRQKAEAKAIKSGDPADYSKCDAKFAGKWADAQANPMCPTTGDQMKMQTCITVHANRVASALNNTGTCELSGLLATGQTTAYGTGSDGDVQAGNTLSYTDNGDGTVTDHNTGLMWEKKDDAGGIHDKNNAYTWCVDVSPPDLTCDNGMNHMDGTIVTLLDTLNDVGGGGATCFAGHCDWRIPNRRELGSIVNFENYNPAVSPAFNTACAPNCTVLTCSCTEVQPYWSSSTEREAPSRAWVVYDGEMYGNPKRESWQVRAVRGGS